MREHRKSGPVAGLRVTEVPTPEGLSRGAPMPEITRFCGIIVTLFFGDHPPPHCDAAGVLAPSPATQSRSCLSTVSAETVAIAWTGGWVGQRSQWWQPAWAWAGA